MKSFAAFAGHVAVDVPVAVVITAAAVLGSLGGTLVADRVPAKSLRRGFGGFVLVMAGWIIFQELGG